MTLNPYAPPQSEPEHPDAVAAEQSLRLEAPIPFAGSPEPSDIRSFLYQCGHVGHGFLFMLGLTIGCILLYVLIAMSTIPATLIACGGLGLLLVVLVVSTVPYRSLVFRSTNLHWDEPVSGELTEEGIRLERSAVTTFFQWEWYCGCVVTSHFVAFLPATQTSQPLFVTRSMLTRLGDWERLEAIVEFVGTLREPSANADRAGERNRRKLRAKRNFNPASVPDGAVPFVGQLTPNHFSEIPTRVRRREKPVRSQLVIATLVTSMAAVVIGVAILIGIHFDSLLRNFVSYLVLGYVAYWVIAFLRNRGQDKPIYYVNAYADETFVVSDFGLTKTTVPWAYLGVVQQSDEMVVLQRQGWLQFTIARREMFASENLWERFRELVAIHTRQP
ncbi:MAG: hypothetical protein AB8B91_01570 [Rubripirellula sp.]